MRWLVLVGLLTGCGWVFDLERLRHKDGGGVADADIDAPPTPTGWTRVIAAKHRTCALDADARLWCWGRNDFGDAGLGTTVTQLDEPMRVSDAAWSTIDSYAHTTCGIQRDDGSLWCWGLNHNGAVGQAGGAGGDDQNVLIPRLVAPGKWLDVAAGGLHACGIRDDRSIWCWGNNSVGQLGDSATAAQRDPVLTRISGGWARIAAGFSTSCAITMTGELWCWGSNDSGQVGKGMTSTAERMPVHIGTDTWTDVAVGESFACGITTGNQLRCWGNNAFSQLGDGTTTSRVAPSLVIGAGTETWLDIDVGRTHACARAMSGTVKCWGRNDHLQLALQNPAVVTMPTEFVGPEAWREISTGIAHTCGIAESGVLYCVGSNGYSELADGGSSTTVPVRVGTGAWSSVHTAYAHTCAVESGTNALKCAGVNDSNQIGNASRVPRDVMTMVTTSGTMTAMSGAGDHTCGIIGQTVQCWGDNGKGQLGNSTFNNYTMPTTVIGGNQVSAYYHTCSINSVNQLYCWGQNVAGQVGVGSTAMAAHNSPQGLSGTWSAVTTGRNHTCALDNNTPKNLYCWGAQIGTYPTGLAPTDTGLDAARIASGGFHMCLLDATANAQCWGSNYAGQLGVGYFGGSVGTATAVPGPWLDFAPGAEHGCGVKMDKTLHCWGNNARGQLGVGSRQNQPAPTQIGTAMNWVTVRAGNSHSCAVNMSGELWCWGDNSEGQLANGKAWTSALVRIE